MYGQMFDSLFGSGMCVFVCVWGGSVSQYYVCLVNLHNNISHYVSVVEIGVLK